MSTTILAWQVTGVDSLFYGKAIVPLAVFTHVNILATEFLVIFRLGCGAQTVCGLH